MKITVNKFKTQLKCVCVCASTCVCARARAHMCLQCVYYMCLNAYHMGVNVNFTSAFCCFLCSMCVRACVCGVVLCLCMMCGVCICVWFVITLYVMTVYVMTLYVITLCVSAGDWGPARRPRQWRGEHCGRPRGHLWSDTAPVLRPPTRGDHSFITLTS